MILAYIHGFKSSSKAKKAQILNDVISKHYPDVTFYAPDFPDNIQKALECLEDKVRQWLELDKEVCLVGSSMGGFISVLLSLRFPVKIALINPCLNPHDFCLRNKIIGVELKNPDTDAHFVITADDVSFMEAKSHELCEYRADKTKVYLQTGDTVLDYTLARDFFTECPVMIEEGGCHGYDNFDRIVPDIVDFFKK